jgi:hypothetical protein
LYTKAIRWFITNSCSIEMKSRFMAQRFDALDRHELR